MDPGRIVRLSWNSVCVRDLEVGCTLHECSDQLVIAGCITEGGLRGAPVIIDGFKVSSISIWIVLCVLWLALQIQPSLGVLSMHVWFSSFGNQIIMIILWAMGWGCSLNLIMVEC